jgi:hypothetical protein
VSSDPSEGKQAVLFDFFLKALLADRSSTISTLPPRIWAKMALLPEIGRGGCRMERRIQLMTVSIELRDEEASVLAAKAAAQGLTLEDWLQNLAGQEAPAAKPAKPFKSAYGLLAKYGPAPSAEEIDANRAEMFHDLTRAGRGDADV